MKNTLLISMFVLFALVMHAQKDVVYPEIGKTPIRRCLITDVSNGNMVSYSKDSISSVTKAVAIGRNGNYINLYPEVIEFQEKQLAVYNDYNYDYFAEKYKNAIVVRNLGIGTTIVGLGAGVIGGFSSAHSQKESSAFKALYFIGAVAINVGVVLWVSQGVVAANNKRAMKRAKKNVSISLGVTSNGVGLLLTFNNYN